MCSVSVNADDTLAATTYAVHILLCANTEANLTVIGILWCRMLPMHTALGTVQRCFETDETCRNLTCMWEQGRRKKCVRGP